MSSAIMPRAPWGQGRARAPAAATTDRAPSHRHHQPRRPPALLMLNLSSSSLAPGRRGGSAPAAAAATCSINFRPAVHQQQQEQPQQCRAAAAAAARRRPRVAAAAAAADDASSSSPPLPAPLQRIVSAFQAVPDPMARYKQLLFYAAKLPSLPEDLRTPENKVEGCVSQVWVVPELRGDGRVYWRADSDSQLTKGLAALLVTGLSGCSPAEILSVTPKFVEALGLKQSLTPSRNNGFLNMLRKMQRATLELAAQEQAASASASA